MSAQKELVDLLTFLENGDSLPHECQSWVRDHGSSIAELLGAYTSRCAALKALQETERNSVERASAVQAYDGADDVIFAALRKLTEPKA